MEEVLKQILQKLEGMDGRLAGVEQGQQKLDAKIEKVSDKLDAFEKRTMSQFGTVEKKVDTIQDKVGDLWEFRMEAEGKLQRLFSLSLFLILCKKLVKGIS